MKTPAELVEELEYAILGAARTGDMKRIREARTAVLDAMTAEAIRLNRLRDEMKDQWGVHRNVSFDAVWAHAVILKKQTDHLLDDLVVTTTDAQGFKDYSAKNELPFSNMIAALIRARFPT